MAKGLHFFKFIATEWLTGNIAFEPLDLQGLFINICALYWQRDGKLSVSEIEQRYKKKHLIAKLSGRFFSVNDGFIAIHFLDEQLVEREHISKTNSENGKKGGRPSKEQNKPIVNRTETELKPKKSQLEEEIESEEELETGVSNKKLKPEKISLEKECEEFKSTYGKEMIDKFLLHWTEKNRKGKEKWQMQDTWETGKRLATWFNNSQKWDKNIKPAAEGEKKVYSGSFFKNQNNQ